VFFCFSLTFHGPLYRRWDVENEAALASTTGLVKQTPSRGILQFRYRRPNPCLSIVTIATSHECDFKSQNWDIGDIFDRIPKAIFRYLYLSNIWVRFRIFHFFFFPPLLQRQPFKIHTVRLPWQSPLTSAIVTVFPRIEFKLSNHLNNVFPLRIPWLGSHSSSKRLGFQWYKAGEPRTARCYIPTLLLFSQRLRLAALWQSTSEHPLPAIQAGICICISGNSHFRLTARISTGGASE